MSHKGMNLGLDRSDTSLVARWWCTVDHVSLSAIGGLVICGALLILAATPPIAQRLGLDDFYFAWRQLMLMPVAIVGVLALSMIPQQWLKILGGSLFVLALTGTIMAGFLGPEIKGAQRWLPVGGFSLQPSEFLKPAFALAAAWAFQESLSRRGHPLGAPNLALLLAVLVALVQQPDFGMSMVVFLSWVTQFFLAGASYLSLVALAGIGIGAIGLAYINLPHVAARIDAFLNPTTTADYQTELAVKSFAGSGFFGRGPGEGLAKQHLPDAHADFIFAVAGEEFGFLFCLLIIVLYLMIIGRGLIATMRQPDVFIMLAGVGLLTQIGFQVLINMGSALRLLPAKGMTLPFISYGGSSLVASGVAFGLIIALTRQQFGGKDWR